MLIAATAGLVFTISFLIVVGNRGPIFHGRSILEVVVRETHQFPMMHRDEAGAISNFLSAAGKGPLLEPAGRGFALERVGRMRGYPLFHIVYCGQDSQAVHSAASNAAHLVIAFYATNQPTWQVTLVQTECFTTESLYERLKGYARGYWRRCKAMLR